MSLDDRHDILSASRHLTACVARCIAGLERDDAMLRGSHQLSLLDGLEQVVNVLHLASRRRAGLAPHLAGLHALRFAARDWVLASRTHSPTEKNLRVRFLQFAAASLSAAAVLEEIVPAWPPLPRDSRAMSLGEEKTVPYVPRTPGGDDDRLRAA